MLIFYFPVTSVQPHPPPLYARLWLVALFAESTVQNTLSSICIFLVFVWNWKPCEFFLGLRSISRFHAHSQDLPWFYLNMVGNPGPMKSWGQQVPSWLKRFSVAHFSLNNIRNLCEKNCSSRNVPENRPYNPMQIIIDQIWMHQGRATIASPVIVGALAYSHNLLTLGLSASSPKPILPAILAKPIIVRTQAKADWEIPICFPRSTRKINGIG